MTEMRRLNLLIEQFQLLRDRMKRALSSMATVDLKRSLEGRRARMRQQLQLHLDSHQLFERCYSPHSEVRRTAREERDALSQRLAAMPTETGSLIDYKVWNETYSGRRIEDHKAADASGAAMAFVMANHPWDDLINTTKIRVLRVETEELKTFNVACRAEHHLSTVDVTDAESGP